MNKLWLVFAITLAIEIAIILFLTILSRIDGQSKGVLENFTKAPWLDFLLVIILWIPWTIGWFFCQWIGIVSAILAQILVVQIWAFIHQLTNRQIGHKCHIADFHNQKVGWWRNNLALWATTLVLPGFFFIRLAQIIVYPILIKLLAMPNYKHSEWINISRQKFQGLIGYDLIWCLYCDWMTGVYALGAEMLRNVESFWCPIRFYSDKKCENCKVDFPDIEKDWVGVDKNMREVADLLEKKYSGKYRSWFGHSERIEEK